MNACPACGYTSYVFRDHKVTLEYIGEFGRPDSEEMSEAFHHTIKAPMYCRCMKCNKRFKLSEVRATEPGDS